MTAAPQQSADAFLMGGGGKSASFENIGDTITGTVVSTEVRQQTDLKTNLPKTWDNGDPVMQLVVRLQTVQREDGDDDGIRALYVKGSKKAGSRSLHDAVASAVRSAGAKSLEEGGTLTVTHDGEEPSQTRGFNARKLYTASYVAPDHAAQAGDFLGTAPAPAAAPVAAPVQQYAPPAQQGYAPPTAQPVPQAQQAAPTPAPAPAAALPAGTTPEQVAAYAAYMASQQAPAGS